MSDKPSEDFFIWKLFGQLRRRGFPLCPQDYEALRRAIGAGFGCASRIALRDLCCTLWAKSLREQEVVSALFDQQEALPNWKLSEGGITGKSSGASQEDARPADHETADEPDAVPETQGYVGLPRIKTEGVVFEPYPFSFVPQYPLSYREVAPGMAASAASCAGGAVYRD